MLQLTLPLPFLQWPNPSKDVFIVVKSAPLTACAGAATTSAAANASSRASSRAGLEDPVLIVAVVLSAKAPGAGRNTDAENRQRGSAMQGTEAITGRMYSDRAV